MGNTKLEISTQARILFNEKGYTNVSLREIAKAAGTTIGNLTYHFPQKEDLLLSIQDNLYTDFLTDLFEKKELLDGKDLLNIIINSFTKIKKNRNENEFFYRSIISLCTESPIIAKNVEDFQKRIFHFYFESFLKLKKSAILRNDIADEQYQTLAYIMVYMSYLWIQEATPYYDPSLPQIEVDTGFQHLIYPYLTKKGIEDYSAMVK
ncbi:TetR/AcrR family transcriptional regulator [Enterococcus sp. AZ196]|uniref:TetR/AcrR family transcriptional regulator n=1 Tax=Enterococcus sp. AZ196 TaxID=2774659 RepID=UPI003D29DA00